MTEWEVQEGGKVCQGCRANFLEGQTYQSLLLIGKGNTGRQDYCGRCWEVRIAQGLHGLGAYATWQGHFHPEVPLPKEEPVSRDHAELLFRRLLQGHDPGRVTVLYVLAVMLERKKILKQQQTIFKGEQTQKKYLVYTHSKTSESFTLQDPQVRLAQWKNVESEVKSLLEEELALLKNNG